MRLLRTITVPEENIAADIVKSYLLGVNPLSVLVLELRPLNDTGTLANYADYKQVCTALNRVSITYLGQTVLSMRGEDLAALNWLRYGMVPWEANPANTDNARRAVYLPIVLGKFPFHPEFGFPATLKGQLLLECDFDVADTGYDNLNFSVVSYEMLEARPKEFERKITTSQTFGATGTNDVQLYPGNKNRGILLFGTTGFAGASPAPSWGRVRLLADGVEQHYSGLDWETMLPEPALWGRIADYSSHEHTLDATVAGITNTTSVYKATFDWTNYAYMDFDPSRDDVWTLDTKGVTRLVLRCEAETANAVRAVQVEAIPTGQFTAG